MFEDRDCDNPSLELQLICAVREGDVSKVRHLIAQGADVNKYPEEGEVELPLHAAADYGHSIIAGLLIAAGADVNAKDDMDGSTPLQRAYNSRDNREIAKILLSHPDIDLSVKDNFKQTIFDMPCYNSDGYIKELVNEANKGEIKCQLSDFNIEIPGSKKSFAERVGNGKGSGVIDGP